MAKPWTAAQARAEFAALRKEIGEKAEIALAMNGYTWSKGEALSASLYARGLGGSVTFSVSADSWEDLHAALAAKWAEFSDEHTRRTIRKMALAIIEITADQGACNDASLRQAGFSQAEIDRHGPSACADANEIAANGPFSIATLGGANNAEAA